MDYQEAIEALRLEGGIEITGNPRRAAEFFDAIDVAISALKELREYKQLGALEEVREAVEKQDPKKVEIWNGQAMRPNCRSLFGNMSDIRKLIAWDMPHCKFCGQAIDWSEEE